MDPEVFSTTLYKWDSRATSAAQPPLPPPQTQTQNRFFEAIMPPPTPTLPPSFCLRCLRSLEPGVAVVGGGAAAGAGAGVGGELENLFQLYGIRYATVAKLSELGLTVNTLLDMSDEELDDMMLTLSQTFRWDLLVGEKYGIKSAVRAERRRRRLHQAHLANSTNTLDALSQEGLSEEAVLQQQQQQQQEKEPAGSGGGGTWKMLNTRQKKKHKKKRKTASGSGDNEEDEDDDEVDNDNNGRRQRHREYPFVVTEPGEIARGNKNSLDYLFHLYEQCHQFLIQVQNIAKDKGEKCPAKVTNQVYRYAIEQGASYINKPKMRHYVHCYAFHCLDEKASNAVRKAFKERGENIGAWRQACYQPVVTLAGRNGWDIDAIFNAHPLMSIWYVPTELRKLCHAQRGNVASASNSSSY